MSEPRDARLTGLLLAALDLGDYEDNVVHVLLKFIHSYTQNVLGEAALLALHAGRNPATLEIADVVLAISQTIASSFTSPPDNDSLIPIVAERNKIPLPLIPERFGIRAPPDRYNLTGTNFSIGSAPAAEGNDMMEGTDQDPQPIDFPLQFLPYHQTQYRSTNPVQRTVFNQGIARPPMTAPVMHGYPATHNSHAIPRPPVMGMTRPITTIQQQQQAYHLSQIQQQQQGGGPRPGGFMARPPVAAPMFRPSVPAPQPTGLVVPPSANAKAAEAKKDEYDD
ncbi:MAG: hypothetical protein SGCHY_002055 [Lobulomycetales sp.]